MLNYIWWYSNWKFWEPLMLGLDFKLQKPLSPGFEVRKIFFFRYMAGFFWGSVTGVLLQLQQDIKYTDKGECLERVSSSRLMHLATKEGCHVCNPVDADALRLAVFISGPVILQVGARNPLSPKPAAKSVTKSYTWCRHIRNRWASERAAVCI